MSKLTRAIQKIFGSTSASSELAVIGSLAAGSPAFSSDPVVQQSLPNYLGGWPDVVLGGNSPAIEDLNSVCYLYSRQLAYLFQAGIPEFDATTTYYLDSVFQSGGSFYFVTYGSASGVTGVNPPNGSFYALFADVMGTQMTALGANQIVNTRTRATGSSTGSNSAVVRSSTTGTFTTGSTVFQDVGVSVTITTSGKPIAVLLVPDGSASPAVIGPDANQGFARIRRNGTTTLGVATFNSGDAGAMEIPPGCMNNLDMSPGNSPATNTYTLEIAGDGGNTMRAQYCILVAYEIN